MTDSRRGCLIAFRNDRLGARLISLVNAMRIGSTYDVPVQVHWPEARDVGRVFNDPTEIFDGCFVAEHFQTAEQQRARCPRECLRILVGRHIKSQDRIVWGV